MKANILKLLLRSHAEGNEGTFRKAALQLAASESNAGHVRVADDIRAIIAKMPPMGAQPPRQVVDIATPRGDLADILEGGHRDERMRDIVLAKPVRELLQRLLKENKSRQRLEQFGVSPRRRVLLYGPPGCGKTLTAAVLAGEMGLPLMSVRLDALFSRFLGATAVQLRAIFDEMPRRPGVYLFDEFDSVAKARGDSQDVGEMNRVVTAFLQLVDADLSAGLIVAATNHVELLDRAMFRRFDVVAELQKPDERQLAQIMLLRLSSFGLTKQSAAELAKKAAGWSFADAARACDDAVRTMVLDGREELADADVLEALEELRSREPSATM